MTRDRHLAALPDLPAAGASRIGSPDLREQIERAAAVLVTDDRDKPLAALARRYAREIETAVDTVEHATALARIAAKRGDDEGAILARQVDVALARVAEIEVVLKFGPLLHKALHDLGGAPVARKAAAPAARPGGKLGALRSGGAS